MYEKTRTQPFTPKTPAIRPTITRDGAGSGTERSGRSSRLGSALGLEQVGNTGRQLRALANPVIHTAEVYAKPRLPAEMRKMVGDVAVLQVALSTQLACGLDSKLYEIPEDLVTPLNWRR